MKPRQMTRQRSNQIVKSLSRGFTAIKPDGVVPGRGRELVTVLVEDAEQLLTKLENVAILIEGYDEAAHTGRNGCRDLVEKIKEAIR